MMKYLDKLNNYTDQTALCFGSESYTYSQLNSRISYHVQELSNIEQGNIVALVSDYSFEAISLFLALAEKNVLLFLSFLKMTKRFRNVLQLQNQMSLLICEVKVILK